MKQQGKVHSKNKNAFGASGEYEHIKRYQPIYWNELIGAARIDQTHVY